ncbi:Solute carrier family 25 member 40 [Labeo rohita]|uniref:Solute carrier family 25 member 40 n=1 Tax=Labeo rohita TaxID=84645 RepID=A0ABQ8LWE3_LABRO|nr:Solute carrier family 25 member 40 [Labeo rohita]
MQIQLNFFYTAGLKMSSQKSSSVPTGDITPIQQMIASCSGAIITSLFGKCFVYCNGLMDHICVCENGNSKAWYKTPGHFTGTLDAFIKIIRMEGIRSLWSGLPPTLVMAVPATVIYFTSYDQLCASLKLRMGDHSVYAPLLAGAIARVGSVTVISPLELIRTKMQSEKQSYRELSAVIRSALHNEGWRSMWRGWGPTLLRDVPFSAWLCQYYNYTHPTFAITFTAGALSGSFASIVTLPFDVAKTKRQVELGELQTMKCEYQNSVSTQVSSSTYNVMKRIVAENGVSGLFAVAPACAIMISTYEFGKEFFRKYNQQKQSVTRLQPNT